MSDQQNREGKHSACLISPSLCSSSHALSIIGSTCSTPWVTTPLVPLPQNHRPQPDTQPDLPASFSRAACPRAFLPGLPMPQLTIARTIRIFRGIMTGLVKHSCPWKSLIFLAAARSVPRRAGSGRVCSLQRGTRGSADVPSSAPAPAALPCPAGIPCSGTQVSSGLWPGEWGPQGWAAPHIPLWVITHNPRGTGSSPGALGAPQVPAGKLTPNLQQQLPLLM